MSGSATVAPIPRMPIPMGVVAESGATHPELDESSLKHIRPTPPTVLARAGQPVLAVDSGVDDPMDLTQTGWGVLFPSDADPAIKAALKPLLDLRKTQVNDERLFRIFDGPHGVRKGESAGTRAMSKGVRLSAPVNPDSGVPFYLLMVGSPVQIPFEFQEQFDLQWAVGRLHFDQVADYAAYAEKLVAYETGKAPPQKRRAAIWMPRNPLDVATPLLAGAVGNEFLGQNGSSQPLGRREKFELAAFIGEEATKDRLADMLRGKIEGGPACLYFTGSHGAEWSMQDAVTQRERQGALVHRPLSSL